MVSTIPGGEFKLNLINAWWLEPRDRSARFWQGLQTPASSTRLMDPSLGGIRIDEAAVALRRCGKKSCYSRSTLFKCGIGLTRTRFSFPPASTQA